MEPEIKGMKRDDKSKAKMPTQSIDNLAPVLESCRVNQIAYANLEFQRQASYEIKPMTTKTIK